MKISLSNQTAYNLPLVTIVIIMIIITTTTVSQVEEIKGQGESQEDGRLLNRKRTAESVASEKTQDNEQ